MKTKIFVVTHKECFVPKNPLLVPIQVGATLAPMHFAGMLHDDEGENISEKNRMYCELTAQYWAWKNDSGSDYTGFFHYRRYLNFSGKEIPQDDWGNIIYKEPLSDKILGELGLSAENMERVIENYDAIVPRPRKLPKSDKNIYEQYANAWGQHGRDLETAIEVLTQKYPDYAESAKKYLSSDTPYEVNMFIMRTNLFKEYSEWLFDILFEVEKRSDFSAYNQYELRVMGFLSERLFGIWFTHNREKRNLKTLELQKTLFENTDKPFEPIATEKDAVLAVLACNDWYVPYLAVMLKSVVENAKQDRPYEIFVLTTDISKENQKKLSGIFSCDERFSFKCVNVRQFVADKKLFVHTHISVETYYRFLILDLFPEAEKVLYLDSDMVAASDIADLYDTELGGNFLAAAKDVDMAGVFNADENQRDYVKNTIGSLSADSYFQAGVLLFNLKKMKELATPDRLIKISQEREWNYMDQDVLNHVYKENVLYLGQEWNVIMNWATETDQRLNYLKNAPFALYSEYLEARKNPKIIHYAGFQKPWDVPSCDYAEHFWKYARKTVFYEELLARLGSYRANEALCNIDSRLVAIEKSLKSRKFLIKWILGKGLLYKIARKLWHVCRVRG